MSTMSKSRKALIGVGLAAASMFGAACQVVPPSNAQLVQHERSEEGRASILGLRKMGFSGAGRTNTWCGPRTVEAQLNPGSLIGQMCESTAGGGLVIARQAFVPGAEQMNVGVWNGNGQVCGGTVDYRIPQGLVVNDGQNERRVTCV